MSPTLEGVREGRRAGRSAMPPPAPPPPGDAAETRERGGRRRVGMPPVERGREEEKKRLFSRPRRWGRLSFFFLTRAGLSSKSGASSRDRPTGAVSGDRASDARPRKVSHTCSRPSHRSHKSGDERAAQCSQAVSPLSLSVSLLPSLTSARLNHRLCGRHEGGRGGRLRMR